MFSVGSVKDRIYRPQKLSLTRYELSRWPILQTIEPTSVTKPLGFGNSYVMAAAERLISDVSLFTAVVYRFTSGVSVGLILTL